MTTNKKTTNEQETKTRVEVGKLEANEELTADELRKVKGGVDNSDRLGSSEVQQPISSFKK